MSEKGDIETSKVELIAALKAAFASVVAEALEGATGDVKTYAAQLGQEFGRNLYRVLSSGDKIAAGNLDDLKAQVMLLAVKRELVISHDIMERLKVLVDMAPRLAVKFLTAM